jgi:hypothetical protein
MGRVFTQDGQVIPIAFINDLVQDMIEAEDRVESTHSPTACRDYVRAAFALHEGFLDWFRGIVARWLVGRMYRYGELKITQLYLIGTTSHRITKQGQLEGEITKRPFLNDLAFVIRTGAECWHFGVSCFFSDCGWEQTQKALKIRHRITHPKRGLDLYVNTEELETVRDSVRWLFWTIGSIIRYADDAKMEDIDGLNEVVSSDLNADDAKMEDIDGLNEVVSSDLSELLVR